MEYDYPLKNWIYACLLTDSFEKCITSIEEGKSLDTIIYLKKIEKLENILDEETNRQFHDPLRPIVELVINAIDAKFPGQKNYTVDIKAKNKSVEISDQGESMGIEDILTSLIIPYVTEKYEGKEKEYIGKFGIGFLSVLKYCLQKTENSKQKRNEVIVKTNKNYKAYECLFYADTEDVSSLRLKIKKVNPDRKNGTTVLINKSFDIKALQNYVTREVRSIPNFKALIKWNGEDVNADSGKWYTSIVNLTNIQEKEIPQEIAVQLLHYPEISLTSEGVSVKKFKPRSNIGVAVLFPPLVELTMGRDSFKKDRNYQKAACDVFHALENLILDNKASTEHFIELMPSLISALDLDDMNSIPNLTSLTNLVMPGKEYVLLEDELNLLHSFYGYEVHQKAFKASPQSQIYWQKKYKTYNDFVNTHMSVVDSFDISSYNNINGNTQYPNLMLLLYCIEHNSDFAMNAPVKKVNLVSFTPANNPFMYNQKDNELFINTSHRHISGEYNSLKVNANISNYLMMPQINNRMVAKGELNYIQKNLLLLKNSM
jgi:hypothetical protein